MRITKDDLNEIREYVPEVPVKVLEYLIEDGLFIYGDQKEVVLNSVNDEGFFSLQEFSHVLNNAYKEGYTKFSIIGYRKIEFVKPIDYTTIRSIILNKIEHFDIKRAQLSERVKLSKKRVEKDEANLKELEELIALLAQ